ncbi:MAG: hypothetical protein KDB02_14435, partial [Acidimicrobiales bacterium]|nr:hypothetical protein [Acidimicrobiales bacterium]
YPVHHDGRNFYYGSPEAAAAANELVADLGRLSKPGERLLVGPVDFRFTPYSDAFFYFLFPDLVPATRYIEMDPGIANAPDSGLADEVASADWLILSNVWTNWAEPNASLDAGSDAPNKVVQEKFCKVGAYGNRDGAPWFELYRRCTKPSATARSTLGLALTASGDWAILVDGLSGNPASTRVTAGGREFRVPGVPLIDPYLFWHNGNLIVAGFDCPNLDTETLGGDTAADCGTLAQTVLRLDLEAEKLTVVARSIPTDEFAPGPLVGDTLLLDNGATLVHLSDGSVTKGRALPASVARCGSGGGLVELLPTSKDSPGSMEPITRIRATEADAGTDVTAGLPWGQGGIEGVAGCTADGVAVYVTTDDVAVYELTRRGDAIRSRRLGGPGLGPDWNIQVAGDRRTLVATKQQGESTERRVWTGDRWLPVPNTGRNPGQVTVTESAVISVSGDEAVATISEVPK